MTLRQLIEYLSAKPGAKDSFPFGPKVRVFKVCHKMFGLIAEDENPPRINLKCDPDQAVALRDMFDAVLPGYHMNKKHWNTVILDDSIPQGEIESMIDHSYQLIVDNFTKQQKLELQKEIEDAE
ncbi:MmcQ/YjbR family DNA-binding protein [Aliikangiella maris]|uniref:MmcQ/YjbR family DNA-binding protein n=2 Tax=Aliikangiella maris TaxID=3162458 RepID=A0ABV2BUH2_9GAMM